MSYVAFITGVTGQDGSYISELLLHKGYFVVGLRRKTTVNNLLHINHLLNHPNFTLRYGDMCDANSLINIIHDIKIQFPNLERLEVYNLAGLTHVGLSFDMPELTANVNALGPLRLLEAIRKSGYSDKIRFYQASTSELFGKVEEIPQTEETKLQPRSPYACSKLFSHWITKNYREAYGLYACSNICMNHEGERRDPLFVTRKITMGLADILAGKTDKLILGNINASRDWGHAKDFVRGMWMTLQQNEPDDFVLSTGMTHTVREFIEKAFKLKGFEIQWKGTGFDEIGYDKNTGRELIFISEDFFRPAEVDFLLGDSSKAKKILGWEIEYNFDDLVKMMVEHDCGK